MGDVDGLKVDFNTKDRSRPRTLYHSCQNQPRIAPCVFVSHLVILLLSCLSVISSTLYEYIIIRPTKFREDQTWYSDLKYVPSFMTGSRIYFCPYYL